MCANFWAFDADSPAETLRQAILEAGGGIHIDLAVILGSGWSHLAGTGRVLAEFPYRDWSCFPERLVAGHDGRLTLVELSGKTLLCFAGRSHCYQGFSAFEASFPVRLAASLKCSSLLLTCAAGAVNETFVPGDFVWVTDHLDFLGDNPLRGLPGDVFVDLSSVYDLSCYHDVKALLPQSVVLRDGVLASMPGPSYETPAEVRMLAALGADLVSMSMVHEAIMARYLECDVVGLALVANRAAGLASSPLKHDEVLECARRSREQAQSLFSALVRTWPVS